IYLWNTNEGFREAVIAASEWIKEKAQQVWDAIGAAIDTAVNWISEKIDEIKAIPGKVRDWFEQMKMWAISKAVELVNWIKGLPQRILTALGNLGTLLVNAGRDLLTGLWNGITGAAGWLRDKIRGFFSGLLPQWAKNFLGIGSPSKVFRDEIGRWIPEGVAEGIEDNTSTVERASKGMASQALSAAAVSGVEGRSVGGAGVRSPEVRFTGNTSDA